MNFVYPKSVVHTLPDNARHKFYKYLSSSQLKGVIVDESLKVIHEEAVEFDSQLPEFRTHKGAIQSEDGKTVLSPTIMWVKALDMLLDKLQVAGADFGKLAAISGCGQVSMIKT